LGGFKHLDYKTKMADNLDDILSHALCPFSLFKDDYDSFIRERSQMLASFASQLLELES